MVATILDPLLERDLVEQRRATGVDKYDEVWDGVYVMSPLTNDEHQAIVSRLTRILDEVVEDPGLGLVRPGVNVTDREDDWRLNYRCPDVVVFLKDTAAENRGTHWFGGPDLAIEVTSPDDRTLDKLPFYEAVGTRELLVLNRDPWELTLYRLTAGSLRDVGRSSSDGGETLVTEVVPLSWQLLPGSEPQRIEVVHTGDGRRWTVPGHRSR